MLLDHKSFLGAKEVTAGVEEVEDEVGVVAVAVLLSLVLGMVQGSGLVVVKGMVE